jgi:hypothetical protein
MIPPSCWKNQHSLYSSPTFSKIIVKICPNYVSEFPVSKSKMGLTVHVTLMTYLTQTVVSCNGTIYISLGLSADQYLLF